MRVRPTIGVLLVLMLLIGPMGSGAVRAQVMCDRVAKVLGMASQTSEAASRRWTDCLRSNRQCQTEQLGAQQAQNTLERTRAQAKRQCPDLAN